MARVVIQDTWDEPDDVELIDYSKSLDQTEVEILSEESICADTNITTLEVLFADSSVINTVLKWYTPPDTYPDCFQELYHRQLRTMKVEECLELPLPYFVKPARNEKSFDGFVVREPCSVDYLRSEAEPNTDVIVADVVTFQNEFRVFLGQGRAYGVVESTEFILDGEGVKAGDAPPPEFIDKVIALNPYPFCVVDVGRLGTGEWAVVEVNPPYALSSYDWPIAKYYEYCRDAWQTLKGPKE